MTFARHDSLRPTVPLDSSGMRICRGLDDGGRLPVCGRLRSLGTLNTLIFGLLIRCNEKFNTGFSPKSVRDEQLVKIAQRLRCHAGRSERHAGADGPVAHPPRHSRDNAWLNFNMQYAITGAHLAADNSQSLAVCRVPPIVNFDFLLDMGRMSREW
jgi:hypothetical protein